jgi:thiol-disulfide isomerase/thioredoxin
MTMRHLILLFSLFATLQMTAQEIQTMDLSELQERIYKDNDTTYVINFWATWCGPCIREMPYFQEFSDKHRDGKVQVILVSLDFSNARNSRLIPFVEQHGITAEVIHFLEASPPNDWIPEFSKKWSGSIPATLVLNGEQGVDDFYEQSFHSVKEIESIIKKIK